jgi:hypothetical protein
MRHTRICGARLVRKIDKCVILIYDVDRNRIVDQNSLLADNESFTGKPTALIQIRGPLGGSPYPASLLKLNILGPDKSYSVVVQRA